MKRIWKPLLAAAATAALPVLSSAQIITLADQNSIAQVNASSSAGMFSWQVDGTSQLAQQWFWFRVGNAGGEAAINSISAATITQSSANIAKIDYTGGQIKVETTYILTGGAANSHQSDMLESIKITNTSAGALDYHFFQYTDFDLNGTTGGDTVTHSNVNTFDQSDGVFGASETISTPAASHWQAAFFNTLLASLSDGAPTTLSDGPVGPLGPGDCTFAWQWDFTLGGGQSFVISKDKSIVPEPMTILVLGAGLAVLAARRRK